MKKYIIERMFEYKQTTIAEFDDINDAFAYGESIKDSGGVIVLAEYTVDSGGNIVSDWRKVYKVW